MGWAAIMAHLDLYVCGSILPIEIQGLLYALQSLQLPPQPPPARLHRARPTCFRHFQRSLLCLGRHPLLHLPHLFAYLLRLGCLNSLLF